MGTDNIIVREYLESLSEKDELDKIFPLLLSVKGFKIIRTAKEAAGQSQYGKDIIAVGKDTDGITKRFYYELKGHTDKDIDMDTIRKSDGIYDSFLEMAHALYEDSGIPGFNTLPVKAVLVHNGVVKPNAMPTLEGMIKKVFKDGDFERWGIYELTVQFSDYLFNEYLLTDSENTKLFKRTLVLLNAPDYDLVDFSQLLDKLLANEAKTKTRAFTKLFATLNLLGYIIFHYSQENNNLEPAKQGLTILVLKTWAWILKNKIEQKGAVINAFKRILDTQYQVLNSYFQKTLPAARLVDGLFSEKGGPYENVGYSMRSMEYLSYLIYYFHLRHHWPTFGQNIPELKKRNLEEKQKEELFKIIDANRGCKRPLLDRHSKPILLVALFLLQCEDLTSVDKVKLNDFIVDIFDHILLMKSLRGHLPEFRDNMESLLEYMGSNVRPDEYCDSSSMLLLILFELVAIMNNPDFYLSAKENFNNMVDYQTAYPYAPGEDLEQQFFDGNTHEKMAVESSIALPDDLDGFKQFIKGRPTFPISFRTDTTNFSFLRLLPVIYYHNDIFPEQWRKYVQ